MTGRQLEVRLFGQPDIRYGGEPIKFAKRSATLAMLALLVLKRGRPLSRESLAFTLFPDDDETNALAELRRYLYRASKALPARTGDPWILTDADTVRWNDDAGAFVDVVEFERLAADRSTQQRAVELYTGDLMESVYDDWVLAERERLRDRYFGLLDELIERYRAERNFAAAIGCAKRVLSSDPWREDALRSLVALRYESGDTAGALAEYDRFARRLRDELAIAPMPETVAVRQSILRQEAVPGAVTGSAPDHGTAQRRAVSILPFVGRTKESATLYNAWGRAARGSAGLVVIAGEAGIGKSRLTAEFARTVQAEGGRVFAGTTSSPESMPYQALVEALRSGLPLLQARQLSRERRTVLSALLPELRDPDVPDVIFSDNTPERATARIYEALSHAVRGLASPRPLLLVLEDLHWAGSATIEALASIFRDATRSPLLVVATCRQEETPVGHPLRALVRSLRNYPGVEELELEPLDEAQVGELLGRIDALQGRDKDLARSLYAQCEGNALFLEGAIDMLLENREPQLAATMSATISNRIERLGAQARSVAEIAAVAGAGCSVPLVREVSNLSSTSIARALDELLDRRILREAGARSGYDYVFSHHLIAAAVYAGIEAAFREQRHFRIAECLEATISSNASISPREIARHYESAGARDRAARWYLAAARAAAAVHAHGDAIELAGRALENAEAGALRRTALEIRETARSRRGDRDGQRHDIDALMRLAGDDAPAQFDVLLRRIFLARALGDSDDERRQIAQLERLAAQLDDPARAKALAQVATHAGLQSRSADGIEPARRALEIYERCGDVQGQLECLCLLVESTTNVGDLETARRYLSLMRERAASLRDRAIEARALAVAAVAALLRQDYRECYALTERSLELHVALDDREGEAASRGRLAVTAVWLGDYTLALREFDAAIATYEALGHKRGLATSYTNRTLLLMRVGLFEEAMRSIERSNELFEKVQERRTIAANQVNASFVNLHLGKAAEAKALAESALRIAREIGYPVFEGAALANLGNAERVLGELGDAITHMEAGLAIRRAIQEPRDFADDLADLTLAYLDGGRNDDAFAAARELYAIGSVSFEGAFWPPYAWWAAARGLAAGGAEREASEAAERARRELHAFAERIADERTRAAFLSLPINRTIAHAR